MCRSVASLIALALAAGQAARAAEVHLVPHRRGRLAVDGSLADWTGPALRLTLREPERGAPEANTCNAAVAWDEEALWVAFTMEDREVFPPPPRVPAPALYQWDSVEIYVGAGERAAPRMGPQDFQFLVGCDGQTAVLRGDDLLAPSALEVPKRVDAALSFASRVVRTAEGYAVECAIPWSAMGVLSPRDGMGFRLDLTWNDWTADHLQLPEVPFDMPNLDRIFRAEKGDIHLEDPFGVGAEAARRIFARHYAAWGWSGTRDFGHPLEWHSVRLTGRPAVLESAVRTFGIENLLVGAAASVGLVALGAAAVVRTRHRRRIAALTVRLARFESSLVGQGAVSPPPPQQAEEAPGGERVQESFDGHLAQRLDTVRTLVTLNDPIPRDLASRAIAFLYRKLGENVSVSQLAADLHVSRRTLARQLAAALSCTPSELIVAVRMREAQRLLLVERQRVKEVAYSVGFASIPHFSRTFKRYFGCAPSEFVRGERGNGSRDRCDSQ